MGGHGDEVYFVALFQVRLAHHIARMTRYRLYGIVAPDHLHVLEEDLWMPSVERTFPQKFLGVHFGSVLGLLLHWSLEHQVGVQFVETGPENYQSPLCGVVLDTAPDERQLAVTVGSDPVPDHLKFCKNKAKYK